MGKVPGLKREDTSANLVTSLLIKNSSIADLCKMDILGIMDAVETKSKEEIEKNAVDHFMKTVDRDEKGRYIWLNEVVIEKVPKEEIGKSSYYLPHRSVIQKNSTTSVRPVLDASCPPFHLGSSVELPFGGNKEYISEILKSSFYVDNCVTSVCDAEELSHFIEEAKQLLAMACFDLQGWEHKTCNPADPPSRGCSVQGFLKSRWWEGPQWLKLPEENWPVTDSQYYLEEILPTDLQKKFQTLTNQLDLLADVTIPREWRKLEISSRAAWKHLPRTCNPADLPSRGCSVQGFLKSRWWEGPQWLKLPEENWPVSDSQYNLKEILKERKKGIVSLINSVNLDKKRVTNHLTVSELDAAEKVLVKIVQHETLKNENVESISLSVFTDSNGLIRLKTKITRRDDAENFIIPFLLPLDHPIVERLIFERHLHSSHAGTQVVLTDIRQTFWFLRGRKTVQRVISKCVRCKRYAPERIESIPAPLPEDRVRETLVFEITAVDLAGPLHLRDGKKAWILLYTWAVYRAIRLELIQSLSANGFLLGFRRFIARRGSYLVVGEGGRKRLVQMMKKLLRRALRKASLYYEEIFTTLSDTEATINSRSLNCLSEVPNDLTPLTPSMFIKETRAVGVPDLDNLDKLNISKRFQYQQALRDNLRNRFRDEYLSMLIQRPNRSEARHVKLGDIVIVGIDIKK
ncbi:integrase catalytic domain-containing protein [Trichonephila clavipes]|nr:integrase catalytic domain-containing protein [Trichonephila clavipes]